MWTILWKNIFISRVIIVLSISYISSAVSDEKYLFLYINKHYIIVTCFIILKKLRYKININC